MTKWYYIKSNTGIQGSTYYRTRENAQAAADVRTAMCPQLVHWVVCEIWLHDDYCDDPRPYIKPR